MFCFGERPKDVTREIPDTKVEKRHRTAFSTAQLSYLESEYKKCPYSEHDRLCRIANFVNKPEKVVKVWFQNRRSREKKTKKFPKNTDNKIELNVPVASKWQTFPAYPAHNNLQNRQMNNLIPMKMHQTIDLTKSNVDTNKQNLKIGNSLINNNIKNVVNLGTSQNMKSKVNKFHHNKIEETFKRINTKVHKNVTIGESNRSKIKPSNKTYDMKPDMTIKNVASQNFSNYNNEGINSAGCLLYNTSNSPFKNNLDYFNNFVQYNTTEQNNTRPKVGLNQVYAHRDVNRIHNNIKVKQQKNCNCNCVPKNEGKHKNKSYAHIPYVVIIPCFK